MFKLQIGRNDCTNKEYHSDKSYFSSSQLKLLLQNPYEFHRQHVLGEHKSESKPEYDFGSLVHTLVLEPHMLDKEFAVFSGMRKQGKDWDNFKQQHASSGKTLLNASQMHNGLHAQKALKNRPEIVELLSGSESEVSICQIVNEVPVKKRSDAINVANGYIVDVKTTSYPAGVDQFRHTVEGLHYGFSAGQYTAIAEQYYGRKFDFYWAVYSKSDLQWDLYKCSKTRLANGQMEFFQSLEMYKQCIKTGIWLTNNSDNDIVVETQYEVQEI